MPTDLQAELEQLKTQVSELTKKNEVLAAAEKARVLKQYDQFYNSILQVVDQGDVLETDFDNLVEKMKTDELYIELMEANNPSANILGFRFIDVINQLATKHLLGSLNEADTIRFKSILNDTIHPPFLNLLAQATPITHLISRVVSKVTNFVKSVRGRSKTVVPSIEKAFDEAKIKKFKSALSKYVIFYDSLLQAMGNYNADVAKLKTHKDELILRVDNYYGNFLALLEVNASDNKKLQKINKRLAPSNFQKNEDFLKTMEQEANQQAFQISLKFPELKKRIHKFQIQYNAILIEFFAGNLKTLETATSMADQPKKLKTLIKKIKARIASLEKANQKLQQHFSPII